MVRAFFKAIEMNIHVFFQYRGGFILSLIAFPTVLIVNVFLFESLYAYTGSESIKGYTLSQMIWYFAAVPLIYIFIFNFVAFRLSQRVISGELTMDLLRPLHIIYYELATAIAGRITSIIIEFIPTIFIYSLIYYPSFLTVESLLKFFIVIILSFVLMFLLNFIIGMTAFVFKDNRAIEDIKGITLGLLGGAAIPLDFLPESIRAFNQYLPFKYVFYVPLEFFLNKPWTQSTQALLNTVASQLIWIAVFFICIHFMWSFFSKRFCSAGG